LDGLQVLQVDQHIDTVQFYQQALAQGIVLTPRALFLASGYYKNYLRLSFAHPTVGRRENSIKKLGEILWPISNSYLVIKSASSLEINLYSLF
jgi:DNA-binding transcriptional MocR family regulator